MIDIVLEPLDQHRATLAVTGRLDVATATTFRAAIQHAIDDGTTKIVVDLSRTTFIDSSGLGALLGSYRRTRDANGDLRIAAPIPTVLDILTLMRLDRTLHPYDTTEQALADL